MIEKGNMISKIDYKDPFTGFALRYGSFVRNNVGLILYKKTVFSFKSNPAKLYQEVMKKAKLFINNETDDSLEEVLHIFDKIEPQIRNQGIKLRDEMDKKTLSIIRYFDPEFEPPLQNEDLKTEESFPLPFNSEYILFNDEIEPERDPNIEFKKNIVGQGSYEALCKTFFNNSIMYYDITKQQQILIGKLINTWGKITDRTNIDMFKYKIKSSKTKYTSAALRYIDPREKAIISEEKMIQPEYVTLKGNEKYLVIKPKRKHTDGYVLYPIDFMRSLFIICDIYNEKINEIIRMIIEAAKNIKNCSLRIIPKVNEHVQDIEYLNKLFVNFGKQYYDLVAGTSGLLLYEAGFLNWGKDPAKIRKEIIEQFASRDIPEDYESLKTELQYLNSVVSEALKKIGKKGKQLTEMMFSDANRALYNIGIHNYADLESEKIKVVGKRRDDDERCFQYFENLYRLRVLIKGKHDVYKYHPSNKFYEDISGKPLEILREEIVNILDVMFKYNETMTGVIERLSKLKKLKFFEKICISQTVVPDGGESNVFDSVGVIHNDSNVSNEESGEENVSGSDRAESGDEDKSDLSDTDSRTEVRDEI